MSGELASDAPTTGTEALGRVSPTRVRGGKDIDTLYVVLLGRLPENEFVRRKDIGQFLSERVLAILESEEFRSQVVERFLRSGVLPHEGLPPGRLAEAGLAAAELGLLPPETTVPVEKWQELLAGILGSPLCGPLLGSRFGSAADEFVEALRASAQQSPADEGTEASEGNSRFVFKAEIVADKICRGWILDRTDLAAVLHVRVKLNGQTAKVLAADEFRRDVQDRYGGAGRCGFTLRLDALPDAHHLSRAFVEISELSQGIAVLPECLVEFSRQAALRLETEIRRELLQLRQTIERIDLSLPRLAAMQSWPLSAYTLLQPTIDLAPSPPPRGGSVSFVLVVVADAGRAAATRSTLASVLSQARACDEVFLIAAADPPIDELLLADRVHLIRPAADEPVNATLTRAASAANGSHLLVLDAGTVLAQETLAWFEAAVDRTQAILIYPDYEHASQDMMRREQVNPVFLAAFDPELLHQRNYIGHCFCIARDAYIALNGFSADPAIDARHDFLLRAAERFGRRSLMHLPVIAYRRSDAPEDSEIDAARARAMRTIAAHFGATGRQASVAAHDDPLGRVVPDAAKIVWPDDPSSQISLIVPTRDDADLVRALIASLRRHTSAWDRIEIVVMVNGDPDTAKKAAFAAIEKEFDRVRVVYRPIEFNWGAINNAAVREFAKGDYLVFLNDDMLCVTPDWDVRLRGQLARRGVAVLGGRLLYPNGLVQHAGIVLGHDAQILHEAAGDMASDGLYLDRSLLVHETAAVTGAFLACRRATFETLGGFDAEQFAVTLADVDFCLRARSGGGSVVYDPGLSWIHYESATRGFDDNDAARRGRFDEEFTRWRSGLTELEMVDLTLNPYLVRSPRAFELFHRIDEETVFIWLEAQLQRRAFWPRQSAPLSTQRA